MQGLCALRIFRIANTKKRIRKFRTQCAETFSVQWPLLCKGLESCSEIVLSCSFIGQL